MLIPVDGSDASVRAVSVAGRIARRLGSPVQLLSIVSDQAEVDARGKWLLDVATEHLTDIAATTAVAVADDVVDEIVNVAEPGDLVAMATAGSVRFHSGHFGSVAEGVARALGRPMLMVGPNVDPHPGEPTQRVIAPIDGSVHSTAAVEPAATLAKVLGVPLWLVTVESPIAVAGEAGSHSGVVSDADETYLQGLARRVAESHGLEAQHEVLLSENPDRAIVDFAGDDGTVVMSTHGRSGISRLFAGSTTAGVVSHSPRAVAVISPEEAD